MSKENEEKYYIVNIVETSSKTVKVKAHSLEEAQEKVTDAWDNCHIIIEPEDFDGVEYFPRNVRDEDLSCYEEVE